MNDANLPDDEAVSFAAMTELEQSWSGDAEIRPGSQRTSARQSPGHLDLEQLAHEEPIDSTLGAQAVSWAQGMLEVARFEVARADDKANTMFRFYGVVAALSIGMLSGKGWSPTSLAPVAQVGFWLGCAALLASGVYLGSVLYPRNVRSGSAERLLYFGHVLEYDTVDALEGALRSVEGNYQRRIVEQLYSMSRLVDRKYALTRNALRCLGVGTALCLASVLLSAVI